MRAIYQSLQNFAASSVTIIVLALASTIGATNTASAGGFALREQSSYYQGLSFAGNATSGPSMSSMFWNPATLASIGPGLTFEAHNSFIIPNAEIDGTFTSTNPLIPSSTLGSGDIGNDAFVPAGYIGLRVSEKVAFGVSVNGPYGLSTKPRYNWAGQYYSRSSNVFSINVAPTIAYEFNDMFSFGAGVQIQYLDIELKSALDLPPFDSGTLKGDDVAFGFTLGATIKPLEGTEIGLGYRSAIFHELSGSVSTPGFEFPLPGFGISWPFSPASTPITAKAALPDLVTLSLKQRVTNKFRVMGTVEWSNWSRLGTIQTVSTGSEPFETTAADPLGFISVPLETPELPFNYNDGWFFALGGEYDFNDKITGRAGIAYEISPIETKIRSTRLTDADRWWFSAGISYEPLENLSFDLGYSFIATDKAKINISPGHQDYDPAVGSYVGDADPYVNIITASLRYRWGGPKHGK